ADDQSPVPVDSRRERRRGRDRPGRRRAAADAPRRDGEVRRRRPVGQAARPLGRAADPDRNSRPPHLRADGRAGQEGPSVTEPALVLPLILFAFGACIGSFLNVVIYRLPREDLSVTRPRRSFCPGCTRPIPAWENVPIVSWLVLGGRCRGCKAEIPIRYLVV